MDLSHVHFEPSHRKNTNFNCNNNIRTAQNEIMQIHLSDKIFLDRSSSSHYLVVNNAEVASQNILAVILITDKIHPSLHKTGVTGFEQRINCSRVEFITSNTQARDRISVQLLQAAFPAMGYNGSHCYSVFPVHWFWHWIHTVADPVACRLPGTALPQNWSDLEGTVLIHCIPVNFT